MKFSILFLCTLAATFSGTSALAGPVVVSSECSIAEKALRALYEQDEKALQADRKVLREKAADFREKILSQFQKGILNYKGVKEYRRKWRNYRGQVISWQELKAYLDQKFPSFEMTTRPGHSASLLNSQDLCTAASYYHVLSPSESVQKCMYTALKDNSYRQLLIKHVSDESGQTKVEARFSTRAQLPSGKSKTIEFSVDLETTELPSVNQLAPPLTEDSFVAENRHSACVAQAERSKSDSRVAIGENKLVDSSDEDEAKGQGPIKRPQLGIAL